MGERSAYAPNTFCWTDLSTTDPAGAVAFYGGLFGWEPEGVPMGDGMTYTLMRLDGRDAAAIAPQMPEGAAAGVPPAWTSYVSVEDADAVGARATELGGSLIAPAFDVFDLGRMALLADPQGAVVAAWQPRSRAGAEVVNGPGALSLNQLDTDDPESAAEFHAALFGWEFRMVSEAPPYWGIFADGALNGGMMPLPPGSPAPPHWLVYFGSDDLEASAEEITRLGGTVVVAPTDAGEGGRILVAGDPQGAYFALYEGRFDP